MSLATYEGGNDLADDTKWSGGSGTNGKPTAGDSVLIKTGNIRIDTNLGAFSGVGVLSVTKEGDAGIYGDGGESLEFDVDATGGTKTLDIRGEGKVFFNGATSVAKCRRGELWLNGGAHVDLEASGPGKIIVGASATFTGDAQTTGEQAASITARASGTAVGNVKNDARNGKVRLIDRNVGNVFSDAPGGAVTTLEGTSQITTGGRIGGGNTLRPIGSATHADCEFKPGSLLDHTDAEDDGALTDSTWHEGAALKKSQRGFDFDFNADGGTNASTEVGAPNPTSSLV